MLIASHMRRCTKILSSKGIIEKEGIIEKISYDSRAYESVEEKSLYLRLCAGKRRKKEFMHLSVKMKLGSQKRDIDSSLKFNTKCY